MLRERENPGDNCGTGPMSSAALSGLKGARPAEPIGEYVLGLLVCILGQGLSQAMDSRSCAGRRQGGVCVWAGAAGSLDREAESRRGLAWGSPEVPGLTLKAVKRQVSGCGFLLLTSPFLGRRTCYATKWHWALGVGWGERKGLELCANWVYENSWLPQPTCKEPLFIPIYSRGNCSSGRGGDLPKGVDPPIRTMWALRLPLWAGGFWLLCWVMWAAALVLGGADGAQYSRIPQRSLTLSIHLQRIEGRTGSPAPRALGADFPNT